VSTASPDPDKSLKPGEVNPDLIPHDWPLTPLQGKKAYIPGWTKNPFTLAEIKKELKSGKATGVGLLCGQFCNEYGLIFVDVDGEEAIPAIEALGGGSIDKIFPPTLTISSGKKGKFRMLFRVPVARINEIPDKATIKVDKTPWEILWRSRQGAIMGNHPDTDGYRTLPDKGFEYANKLPDLPEWLYTAIKDAYPSSKYRRRSSGPTAFIGQHIELNYDDDSQYTKEQLIQEAAEYLNHLNIDRCNDYEEWLAVGMSLHQIAEELLASWIGWSSKSNSFQPGICEEKWRSFERMPGGPNPPEGRGMKTLRAMAKEDGWVDLGGYTAFSIDELKQKVEEQQTQDHQMLDNLIQSLANDEVSENIPQSPLFKTIMDLPIAPPKRGGKSKDGRVKNPPSSDIADLLHEWCLNVGWCYDPRFDTFMFYIPNRGFWRREEYRKEFAHVIQDELTCNRSYTPAGFSSNLVNDVVELLKQKICRTDWNDSTDKIVFTNGVLEVSTGEFTEHNKEDYITWGLDFNYDPTIDPGPITKWIFRTQYDDESRVQVLRAWLRACLVGHGHELQRFLEIIGPGGRGKSTFANLCCALVGAGNYASTTLNQLEQSRFELSSIKGKRMTLINDSERYGGSAQVFKALTGGDNLRYEEKMKNIGEPFVYMGMVMVAANEPIQTTDNTSGLIRRRLTIEFNRKLYDKSSEAKDMIKIEKGRVVGEWKNYLPGLINWVLEMDEKEMRRYLLDTYEAAPSLKRVRNTIMLTSNNLIEWLQSEIVADDKNVVPVGKKIPNTDKDMTERYFNSNFHLYPSYCEYCDSTGSKAVGQKRFISLLLDCCKSQLDMPNIITFTKKGMPLFKGLAIRKSDAKYLNHSTILPESDPNV
jgi:phage/plasmid-associated DNA primase